MTDRVSSTTLDLMHPVLLEIGKFKLYSFGSFIAIGTIAAGLVMYRLAKMSRLSTHHLFDTILYTLLMALLGARLTYYFVYQNQFQSFWQVIYFWQGGLIALGGLIIGFLVYFQTIRRLKEPIWPWLDIGALGLLVGWAVGKIGCHLSGCSVGRSTGSFLGIDGAYPVDFFGLFWLLLLFSVLLYAWTKNRLSDGVIFFLALEGFFLGELLLKTLRLDFGDGLGRVEAVINLTLIGAIYFLFWGQHGPQIEKNRLGSYLRRLILRRK